MYQFEIKGNEAGQRLDKYLHKLLPKAPASFFYKMLRKKNIVLNGEKAEGKEKLVLGDQVSLFLSENTFRSFQEDEGKVDEYLKAYDSLQGIEVLFENEHVVLLNKPVGILSQKAVKEDLSLNEWLIGYLLQKKAISGRELTTFRPSICNRLDRNTGGIVICSKSLAGSRELNRLIAHREIRKFYRLFVKGTVEGEEIIEGYLAKDKESNKVWIESEDNLQKFDLTEKPSYIKTRYYPLKQLSDRTYLEVELITGKTHQIRAHMASVGHPLLGDYKYGDESFNKKYKEKYGITMQLLHSYRLEFPENALLFDGESRTFTAKEPEIFSRLMKEA